MLYSANKWSSNTRLIAIILLLIVVWFCGTQAIFAQQDVSQDEAVPKVHIVQDGENLTVIAEQYDVAIESIRLINHLRDADVLRVGQELIIPGGEGAAVAAVTAAQLGDSLATVAKRFNTSTDALLEANLLINRDYVPVVGQNLSIISRTGSDQPEDVKGFAHVVREGQTLLEIAAKYGLPPAVIGQANDLPFPFRLYPGQRLRIPSDGDYQDLPGSWNSVMIWPENIAQGDMIVIYVNHFLDGRPTGEFAGQELNFVPHEKGYAALIGVDAFTPPGPYRLVLEGSGLRPWHQFVQDIPIRATDFGNQLIEVPEELNALLDPEIRQEEDRLLERITKNFTNEAYWEGFFQVPVTDTLVTAPYGGGRSYNEGPVTNFHTGTDFNGDIGTPILAAANGEVIYKDTLELRGLTVIIDHGLGITTGYYHLSEALVEVGQMVSAGDPIGAGGSSGLSTGPHLHWDLRIMGVPVNGMKWIENLFP